MKVNLHEITEKEVRSHLAKYEKPASRNATIRHLRAFFRWTIKHGWRDGDPTERHPTEIHDSLSLSATNGSAAGESLLVACILRNSNFTAC
ncbi:MAG TPA: hypothetical protein VIS96_17375 [Terrimicrobiaceae bacterium]